MILRLKTYNLETILTVCTFAALLWCDHAMASQPVVFFFFFFEPRNAAEPSSDSKNEVTAT